MGTSLLSVKGKLYSLYNHAALEEERAHGYKQIEIGNPILIGYLYFSL